MGSTVSNLAIIPARSGSKGIPNKNIKLIAGKPLIAWSIEQALAASAIDRVLVTTDSAEIATIARNWGAETPFSRPHNISGDTATTESAITHTLEWLESNEGYAPNNLFLLQPTSPIRLPNTIDKAFEVFNDTNADSLLSVCHFPHFLWKNLEHPIPLYDYRNRPRRQDLPISENKYVENGSIYITKNSSYMSDKNRLCGAISMYEMTDVEQYEVDTLIDWIVVEAVLKDLHRK